MELIDDEDEDTNGGKPYLERFGAMFDKLGFTTLYLHGDVREILPNTIYAYCETPVPAPGRATKKVRISWPVDSSSDRRHGFHELCGADLVFESEGTILAHYWANENVLITCDLPHVFHNGLTDVEPTEQIIDAITRYHRKKPVAQKERIALALEEIE